MFMRQTFFHPGPDLLWNDCANQRQDAFVISEITDVDHVSIYSSRRTVFLKFFFPKSAVFALLILF